MNITDNDSSSVTCTDFPEFEDYDIISGDDFPTIHDVKGADDDDNTLNKTTVELYLEEWSALYNKDVDLCLLKKKSLEGDLRTSRFRSIYWRCLLGILHNEPKQWLLELKTYRSHYQDLWVELQKNPWNVESSPSDNPLSQEAESIWQKYFSNEELKSIIHQDVIRTFPGVNFFRKESIQDLMVRILFCYARQNPSLSYRQGMHEILAPLIYILHCDHQALLYYKNQTVIDNELYEILDPNYIEKDAYSMFKHIMDHIECSYRVKNMISTSAGYYTKQLEDDKNCENEVVNRLQFIKDNILQASDPDLNKHLDELGIPLHLFGIRWLRLLFGWEFPFQELLVLWDAIFSVDNFELVNYVVVSMLTAIRSILLASDYTTCLTNLMHYPPEVDIMFVIEYALHLMNPSLYPAPTVTSFVNKPVTLITKYKKTPQKSKNNQNERLKTGPFKSTKWLQSKPNPLVLAGSGEGDGNIVDGISFDDPKVLKTDFENLLSTVSYVHARLCQYHNILSNNLGETCSSEVKQVLDGISELCSLMKSNQSRYYAEIEPAIEAGETKQSAPVKKANTLRKPPRQVTDTKANTLPRTAKKMPSGELQVFKVIEGGSIVGAPMSDPLRIMRKEPSDDNDTSEENN